MVWNNISSNTHISSYTATTDSGVIDADIDMFAYEREGDELTTDIGYLPMQIGDEYLLFLRAYEEDSSMYGMYHITDRARGKYVSGARTRAQYQIDSKIDLDSYEQWYDAVAKCIRKYLTDRVEPMQH